MRFAAWSGVVSILYATAATAGGNATTTIDLGSGVTLQAPAGVVQVPDQGIDSIVGAFRGEGFECRYDHGLYSGDLSTVEGAADERIHVAGVAARLVSAPPDFDGLHVPEIAKTSRGARRLTVSCRSKDDAARDTVKNILMSLQIAPTE